jgi:hypothetical protein
MSEPKDDASFSPLEARDKVLTVDDVRTTAKRLSAYHDELIAAGFSDDVVAEFVTAIAPHHIEDLVIETDVEAQDQPIGEVRIHMRPQVNDEDVARMAEEIRRRAGLGRLR